MESWKHLVTQPCPHSYTLIQFALSADEWRIVGPESWKIALVDMENDSVYKLQTLVSIPN